MPYAKRDEHGRITELHGSPTRDAQEKVSADDPDVLYFISDNGNTDGPAVLLSASDHELARVVEDIISVLVDKGVIMYTDLPQAAQRKLSQRRLVREGLKSEPSIMVKTDKIL